MKPRHVADIPMPDGTVRRVVAKSLSGVYRAAHAVAGGDLPDGTTLYQGTFGNELQLCFVLCNCQGGNRYLPPALAHLHKGPPPKGGILSRVAAEAAQKEAKP